MKHRHALLAISLFFGWNYLSIAAELHGHRGARGLLPENSLPAFEKALQIGVDCLELDIGMLRDQKLVIAHDPTLNPDLVRRNGQWITERTPLRELDSSDLASLDVGRVDPQSRYAKRYRDQVAIDGTKLPLLADLLEMPSLQAAKQVCLNIEIKTNPNQPEKTFPPEQIADALVAQITAAGLRDRVIVQSFDWRGLVHLRRVAPDLRLSFLSAEQSWLNNVQRGQPGPSNWLAGHDIDENGGSLPKLIKALGGNYWSPYYRDIDRQAVEQAHALGLKVVVWTVNEIQDARELLAIGVDGIITDYPDRIKTVIKLK